MKKRTIEELHDKVIGHKKFASIVDILIADNYKVSDIKEYYEKFTFKIDTYYIFEYRKDWKASAKSFAKYCEELIEQRRRILWR